jgi:hypothetical protein
MPNRTHYYWCPVMKVEYRIDLTWNNNWHNDETEITDADARVTDVVTGKVVYQGEDLIYETNCDDLQDVLQYLQYQAEVFSVDVPTLQANLQQADAVVAERVQAHTNADVDLRLYLRTVNLDLPIELKVYSELQYALTTLERAQFQLHHARRLRDQASARLDRATALTPHATLISTLLSKTTR